LASLPIGTGNILARNLRLPITNLESAAHRSMSKPEYRIDLGIAKVVDVEGKSHQFYFTGIAGTGMDARLMAATSKKTQAPNRLDCLSGSEPKITALEI
jgi:diacylglycerol kinase (ATP)